MCHEVGDADLFVTCRQHKAAWRKKLERVRFFFARLCIAMRYVSKILALTLKNIQVNLIFLVRLFVSLRYVSKILALTLKNIQVNLIFLVRLSVSLPHGYR